VLAVAALNKKSWTIVEPRTAFERHEHPALWNMREPSVLQLSVAVEIFKPILVRSYSPCDVLFFSIIT
jgi:hypothetical protein